MKQTMLFVALALSIQAFAIELPTKFLGKYTAEVPAFEFEQDNKTIYASSYPISITLKSNSLMYRCGRLDFYGVYTNLVKGDDILNLTVNITNEKSIDFNLRLAIDKSKKTVLVAGLTGVPEVNMQIDELVFEKTNLKVKQDPKS